jgi:pimeloyl-ACP methyl ester carboxylesterase
MDKTASAHDLDSRVEHHTADSNGVRIHYAALGEGPLVVMIHGFPDFWYTWRHQMLALADAYRVVAMDLRGYNESDQPQGVENYTMPLLTGDVAAVIAAENRESATVAGHDWGGAISWNVAMWRPELVERLIILNLPHPAGLAREVATNPEQQRNSEYAFRFQQPDAHRSLSAARLAEWITDADAKPRYLDAFNRSSFEAMLNYYKANYPRPDSSNDRARPDWPTVKAPVLMFHGLDDQALLPGALNDTWHRVEQDLTLVTVPGAGHFVQQDATDLVNRTMRNWLDQRRHRGA